MMKGGGCTSRDYEAAGTSASSASTSGARRRGNAQERCAIAHANQDNVMIWMCIMFCVMIVMLWLIICACLYVGFERAPTQSGRQARAHAMQAGGPVVWLT